MKASISQAELQATAVRLGIPDHPFVARRIARAYNLVETNKVNEVSHDDGLYRVRSQYEDKIYTVELNHGNPHCTCPDNERTIFCKHSIASMLVALEEKPNKLVVYDDTFDKRNGKRHSKYGRWIVNDYKVRKGYVVYRDEHGKLHCACGKTNCRHCKAIRKVTAEGVRSFGRIAPRDDGKRIENECGTSEAKSLQDELNGNNGTGDIKSPSHNLDVSNPFQECEQLDIDQIEGRSNGDLVHHLKNGEYVISYSGVMKLAEQHSITFEAARHDETHTVIAHARCGNNSRASGKPANGSSTTAAELAKRNAARMLIPLPEIKALEHKCQLESEFSWEVAKSKCLELLPEANLNSIMYDLIRDGALREAHPSDYKRKEWLLIFDAVKKDAEQTNDDDGAARKVSAKAVERTAVGFAEACDSNTANTASSDEQVTCCICNRTLTNKLSVSRCIGPECFKKVGAQGAQFLRDDAAVPSARREVSEELIKASKLYRDEALQKRILRACLTLDAPPPVKALNWLGNEYFGYKHRPILYYVCAAGQLNRIDTHRRRLRHVIVTSETAETELDAHALAQWSTQAKPRLRRVSPAADVAAPSERSMEVPDNVDEFIAKCREAEAMVDDTTDDNSVDDTPVTNDNDKRMLRMDKNKNITLVEPDGTETPITMRDAAFDFGSNFILRLTQGIACGGDISTVELDN